MNTCTTHEERVYSALDQEEIDMLKIGDKVKRIDYDDPKIYTIDKICEWRGENIYGMKGQGWADGWAWASEFNIKKSE